MTLSPHTTSADDLAPGTLSSIFLTSNRREYNSNIFVFLLIHNGQCVFVPRQGARSRKPAEVLCIRFGRHFKDMDVKSNWRASPSCAGSQSLPAERMNRAPETFDEPAIGMVEGE